MSNTAKNTRYIGARTSASHHKVLEPHFFSVVYLTHLYLFGTDRALDSGLSALWRRRYRSLARCRSFDTDQSVVVSDPKTAGYPTCSIFTGQRKGCYEAICCSTAKYPYAEKGICGTSTSKETCNSWNKANERKFPFSDHCFDWSELVVRVRQKEKAKLGKRLALPNMHQVKLGLLKDTLRKDAGQKTQQTAFGRRSAIKLVWWFHSEMGGLTRMFNCESKNRKKVYKRDDSTAGCDVLWFQRSTSV